jgi:putative hydrolase of the HAD superfamily
VPISTVIFDFGSTLIRSSEPVLEEGAKFLLSRAIPPHSLKIDDLLRFDKEVFQDMLERRIPGGLDFTLTQYLTLLQACLGIRFDADIEEIAFECWFRQYQPKPESGAMDCLRVLKGHGVKLGVLSNTVLTRRSVELALERLGMLSFCDAVLCSSDVAYRKPHSRIFQAILRLLEATPESTAMVGDSLDDDIAGAVSCGIAAVWYNPQGAIASSVKPHHIVSDLRSVPGVLGIG